MPYCPGAGKLDAAEDLAGPLVAALQSQRRVPHELLGAPLFSPGLGRAFRFRILPFVNLQSLWSRQTPRANLARLLWRPSTIASFHRL